jgi:hypothetical protein
MNTSTTSLTLTGVVPAVCDAEAGQQHSRGSELAQANPSTGVGSSTGSSGDAVLVQTAFPPADQTTSKQEFSVRKGRIGSEPSRKPQRNIAHVAMH